MAVLPPCFHLADEVFPKVRAVAARNLVAQGWSQARAAKALGISQAMVSKHVAQPPPTGGTDALVLRLAAEVEQSLRASPGANAAPSYVSPWCHALSASPDGATPDALRDLLEAEKDLLQANPTALVPQIGMNIARALPGADAPTQVLAFPGRIIEAGGRLVSPAPPQPGGSGHLARCLLHLRKRDPAVMAMASARGGRELRKAAASLGWRIADIQARRAGRADPEWAFRAAVDQSDKAPEALHDPGAVGIEPCLYVAGADAAQVARKLLQLHALVNP